MSIPDFVDGYFLPVGEHSASFEEVEARFACKTPTRKKVWENFVFLYRRLKQLGLSPEAILVDGSFVTGRNDPGDVDCAMLFAPEIVKRALTKAQPEDQQSILLYLNPGNQAGIRLSIGAHLLVARDQETLNQWSYLFRKGKGAGLRPRDPERDPAWVVVPEEKGILKIEGNS